MSWPGVLPGGLAKQHEAGFSRKREARFFVGQSVGLTINNDN